MLTGGWDVPITIMHITGEYSKYRGETHKAREARLAEGFFDAYVRGPGIDIGCGLDPVDESFDRWDIRFRDPDAGILAGVEDARYATVYSSHLLEHMPDPVAALREWWRALAPGGHLIVMVPHRDLYERRTRLPSRWNNDHKTFWLPHFGDSHDTWGLADTILHAVPDGEIVLLRVRDAGWSPLPEDQHAPGEYSIEAVVRKPGGPTLP